MLPLSAKLFSRRGTYQLSQVSKLVPVKKNTAIHCCVLFFLVCTVKAVCISVCVCVVVAELIQITVQPQSQEAKMGSKVVLTCRATGPPGLSYQWFRGSEEVSIYSFYIIYI